MSLVTTTKGDLPRSELTYQDEVTECERAVYTTRKWFHVGEVVRQDAWVDMKRGLSSEAQKGN